jgi:ADP-ribose pyrophosphatase YjhB (NUDIX family)
VKLRSISSTCSSGRRPLAPGRRPELAVQDRRPPHTPTRSTAGHCFRCGTGLQLADRADDTLRRLVCPRCQFVHYENPKVLVGGIVTSGDRILLCQRALEPGRGLWAPPAGFLERRESLEVGAVREIWEEAGVAIDPRRLVPYILTSLVDLQQVYVFFRVDIEDCRPCPGPESLAAAFFRKSEVPWEKLAFHGMREYVESAFDENARKKFSVHLDHLKDMILLRRTFLLSEDQ